MDNMAGSYLGPEFGADDIHRVARRHRAPYQHYPDFDDLTRDMAALLAQGQVVGWFQGRMEWGPRALGNRSILGDPRHPEMQKRLNLKIKYREGFRPFAPSVLHEETANYFELDRPSPYMLLVAPVKKRGATPCPPAMTTWSCMTASTTSGPTCRPSPTWTIRPASRRCTGRPTTLLAPDPGLQGAHRLRPHRQHQLQRPGRAHRLHPGRRLPCFMRTEMDYLVMGDYRFDKQDQPAWQEAKDWRTEFELD